MYRIPYGKGTMVTTRLLILLTLITALAGFPSHWVTEGLGERPTEATLASSGDGRVYSTTPDARDAGVRGVLTVSGESPEPDAEHSVTKRTVEALGWHQEAHDAQKTGYTIETVPRPWRFAWQWNGSCNDPLGVDCRPGDPSLGWTFEVPPRAHVVAGSERLYLPAGEHGIWAINESDGQTAWHNNALQSVCTAAFDPEANVLYVAARDGRLYRLDSSDGSVMDTFSSDGGLNLAPTIASQRVYVVSDDGTLYAVNKNTMELDWLYAADSTGQTPVAYSEKQDVLIFGTEDLYVHAVNNVDGSLRWRTKPTVNTPGDFSYDGGDGETYRTHNYEHGWPVIADEHGIVFVRLRMPQSDIYQVPGSDNWFPTTNEAIREFLTERPDVQTLFALNLDDGSRAFVPAVGTGSIEAPGTPAEGTLGPPPVVKKTASGDEVVYTIWRNGQKCEAGECSDPRWDAVMGEMLLDESTLAGYEGGDCRFVEFHSPQDHLITDEMGMLSMAGDTLFHSHWLALYSYTITDRSPTHGRTYDNPILTLRHPPIVNRASNQLEWAACQPEESHFCSNSFGAYGDRRAFQSGFWVFFNDCDPPYDCCTSAGCVTAYSDGYKPRYTIVSNGKVYYQLNGGTIIAISAAAASTSASCYLPLVRR